MGIKAHATAGHTPAAAPSEPRPSGRKRRPSRIEVTDAAAISTTNPSGKSARQASHAIKTIKPAATAPSKAKPSVRRSALDAAAEVLSGLTGDEAKRGVTALDLIERMAKQKLWTSPGGKTPQATLYAAMTREIAAKAAAARFRKVSKGRFTMAAAKRAKP